MKYPEENELLDVVDENDKVIGKATRGECHKKGFLHRIVSTIVLDKSYRVFIGKRGKTKHYRPLEWAIGVGGHVESGETYEEAAKKELKEEIGITENPIVLSKYIDTSEYDKELRKMFFVITEQKIKLDKNEYEEGLFVTYEELKKRMKTQKFIPSSKIEFRTLTDLLKQKGIIK